MAKDVFGSLDVAELTDVGIKRQRNEDASRMLVPPPDVPEAVFGALFIVADGMGGLGGGDIASKSAIDEVVRAYYDLNNRQRDLAVRLQDALESANIFVREQAQSMGLTRIGTTAAGLVLTPDGEAIVFNVGDCRVYRVRNGHMERLSRDQSVMERQIEAGVVTEEAARAMRNSMVTAFLGQPMTIVPHYHRVKVQPGDVFLICSDGLWSLAETDEMLRIIRRSPARAAVRRFINLALKRGGNDNITAILVRFGRPPTGLLGRVLPLLAVALIAVVIGAAAIAGGQNPFAVGVVDASETPGGAGAVSQTPTDAPDEPAPGNTPGDTPEGTPADLVRVLTTATPLATPTATLTATVPASSTPTATATSTLTATATATATDTPTAMPSATPTSTATPAPSATPTQSATPSATASATPSPSRTPSPTVTLAPTVTLNPALIPTVFTLTPSNTPTETHTPSPTLTPTSTSTATATLTPSQTVPVTPTRRIPTLVPSPTMP